MKPMEMVPAIEALKAAEGMTREEAIQVSMAIAGLYYLIAVEALGSEEAVNKRFNEHREAIARGDSPLIMPKKDEKAS